MAVGNIWQFGNDELKPRDSMNAIAGKCRRCRSSHARTIRFVSNAYVINLIRPYDLTTLKDNLPFVLLRRVPNETPLFSVRRLVTTESIFGLWRRRKDGWRRASRVARRYSTAWNLREAKTYATLCRIIQRGALEERTKKNASGGDEVVIVANRRAYFVQMIANRRK